MNKKHISGEIINWKELFKACSKRWWWFLASVAIVCGLTFLYIKLTYEQYIVTSTVLVSDDQQSMPSASMLMAKSGFDFGGMFGGTASVYNEMALMNSYSVCLKTVKELGLNTSYIVRNGILKKLPTDPKRSPIRLTCAPAIPDTLTAGIVFKVRVAKDGKANISTRIGKRSAIKTTDATFPVEINTDYGTFTLDTTSFYKPGRKLSEDIIFLSYSNAAELLSRGVSVKMVNKKADIIQVDMVSPNAFFTRDIVGALIRNYNATGMEQQYARTSATYRFLNERIDSATMHLNHIESQIAEYKKTHNMADFTLTARTDATRYEALHEALRQAETELDVMELVKTFMLNPENNLSLIPQVGDGAIAVQTGIKEYNKLMVERMAVASNARDNNVTLRVMDDQLKLMRDNISTSLNKAIETFRFRLSELKKEVSRADQRLGNIPAAELEYGNIARRQAVEEQLYLYLLQQREETSMKMSNIMPRGVVVDQPHIMMDPVGLSKAKKMVVAFIMGLLIPGVYIFIRIRMRTTGIMSKKSPSAE